MDVITWYRCVQIKDGYLVHQFSPVGLQPIVKNVVFVLDASGSMSGTRLANVIDAMIDILDELHPDDTFNVVSFGTDIRYFNNETCVSASSTNIGNAKSFLSSMHSAGGELFTAPLNRGNQNALK